MAKKNIVLIRNAQAYDIGGAERFPVLLAISLQKNGFQPTIISRSPALLGFAKENVIPTTKGWWWSWQNWNGARTLLTPVYFLWQIVLYVYYVIQFIRLRPGVVHIQSKDDFIAATLAAHTLHSKVVWTDHADLKHIWRNLSVWYKNPIGKVIYACGFLASTITVVSKSEKALVSDCLSPKSHLRAKLKVIYNGAVNVYQAPLPKKPEIIYIAMSRLVADKGIAELIAAFLALHKTHPDTKLWLLGDGKQRSLFEKLAEQNASIVFFGQKSNPLEYLQKATIFVHPTYHEGFSLAITEASMLGLAIIATEVGGNPEIIIDEKTGLLVEPKNVRELQSAMERLYENSDLRETLGKAARKQYSEKFDFERVIVGEFMSLYNGGRYENSH